MPKFRWCSISFVVSFHYLIIAGRDLGQLLDSGDFSDFTLHVGRRSFKCHKAILSARSPFFQAMFRDQTNQESLTGEVGLLWFRYVNHFLSNIFTLLKSDLII